MVKNNRSVISDVIQQLSNISGPHLKAIDGKIADLQDDIAQITQSRLNEDDVIYMGETPLSLTKSSKTEYEGGRSGKTLQLTHNNNRQLSYDRNKSSSSSSGSSASSSSQRSPNKNLAHGTNDHTPGNKRPARDDSTRGYVWGLGQKGAASSNPAKKPKKPENKDVTTAMTQYQELCNSSTPDTAPHHITTENGLARIALSLALGKIVSSSANAADLFLHQDAFPLLKVVDNGNRVKQSVGKLLGFYKSQNTMSKYSPAPAAVLSEIAKFLYRLLFLKIYGDYVQ